MDLTSEKLMEKYKKQNIRKIPISEFEKSIRFLRFDGMDSKRIIKNMQDLNLIKIEQAKRKGKRVVVMKFWFD